MPKTVRGKRNPRNTMTIGSPITRQDNAVRQLKIMADGAGSGRSVTRPMSAAGNKKFAPRRKK